MKGVIVYPIRYETRAETEKIARQQAEEQEPTLPTIGVIHAPTSGTTVPTFPATIRMQFQLHQQPAGLDHLVCRYLMRS